MRLEAELRQLTQRQTLLALRKVGEPCNALRHGANSLGKFVGDELTFIHVPRPSSEAALEPRSPQDGQVTPAALDIGSVRAGE